MQSLISVTVWLSNVEADNLGGIKYMFLLLMCF